MPRPKKSNRSDGRFELKKTIYLTETGERIRKSFYGENKAEAQSKYDTFVREQEGKSRKRKATPFAEWVETWLKEYKEPSVKTSSYDSSYKRPCMLHIVPHFEHFILQEIKPLDVRAFFNSKAHLSASYLDKIKICLNGIFESAIDNGLIVKNPCRNLSPKSTAEQRRKRYYDQPSADRLCASEAKYALAVHILIRMGLRCSELCALKWESIDFAKGIMKISEARTIQRNVPTEGSPKSKTSARRIPIPTDLLERLKREKGSATSHYVVTINGHPSRPDHFNERELEVFYNAEHVPSAQRLTAHELRHTCGSLLYQETKDILHVSRFLGHSDISVTARIYVHEAMTDEAVHLDE